VNTVSVHCTLPLSVNDVSLHHTTFSPHPTASADNLAHNPLHAPSVSCCDVYGVRCDPSDGAGAGVTHGTREVRCARSRRWERSARHVGLAREG